MSNLVNHAKSELHILGTDVSDPEMAKGLIEIVELFAKMQHSGGSAAWAIAILSELLAFHNLTPLTSDPDEWYDHGGVHQNVRRSEAFSKDGGKTYYLTSDREPNPIRISAPPANRHLHAVRDPDPTPTTDS